MSGSQGQIREQIGRIEAKLDAMQERSIEYRAEASKEREQATKERDDIRSELRNIKHESRNDLQVISLRQEKQEAQIGVLTEAMKKIDPSLQSVVTFQRRLTAILAFAVSAGGVIWATRDSIWRSAVWLAKLITNS